jgi:hypothetical protein
MHTTSSEYTNAYSKEMGKGTCVSLVRGKALFLSVVQATPQTNYKIETTQNKHTIHNNKHQADKQK